MMMISGNFTPESQMSSCDEPRGIEFWNLWEFMNAQKPLVKKTTQEYRRWQEREGPDSKRVSRVIGQAALTLLPKGFAETAPWNCDYFTHTSEQSVSRVLRFQMKTPSVQASFTQGNEDAKHCHIQTRKKISAVCVLDCHCLRTGLQGAWNKKRRVKTEKEEW